MKRLAKMASLKITFCGIVILVAGILVTYLKDTPSWLWLTVPLILLASNLAAAMWFDPRLNRRPGLFVFHAALLAIVLMVAFGRLSGFHGRVELVENQAFNPLSVKVLNAGPLYSAESLQDFSFTQGSISVTYAPDIVRLTTHSEIFAGDTGASQIVGDNVPYQRGRYEFYTTPNKGFAALVTWTAADGHAVRGAVHFPSFPLNEWKQTNRWRPPEAAMLELELEGVPKIDESKRYSLDRTALTGMQLHVAGEPRRLSVGDELRLQDGRLRLDGFALWMGYEVRSEPLSRWVFLSAAIGIIGMAWHFTSTLAPLRRGNRRSIETGRAPTDLEPSHV